MWKSLRHKRRRQNNDNGPTLFRKSHLSLKLRKTKYFRIKHFIIVIEVLSKVLTTVLPKIFISHIWSISNKNRDICQSSDINNDERENIHITFLTHHFHSEKITGTKTDFYEDL